MAEAVAITECRMALEGLCAAKAAGRVTGPQAERLLQLGAQLEQARRGRGNRPVTMKGRPDAGPAKPATSASHILKQLHNVR